MQQTLFIGKIIRYQGTDRSLQFDTSKSIGFRAVNNKEHTSWFPFLVPREEFKCTINGNNGSHVLVEISDGWLNVTYCDISKDQFDKLLVLTKRPRKFKSEWEKTMAVAPHYETVKLAITKSLRRKDENKKRNRSVSVEEL